MSIELLIAHAPGEEDIAEQLATQIRSWGYEVVHRGTFFVGESIIAAVSNHLSKAFPVLLCGTSKAAGSKWSRMLVNAAQNSAGVRVFALQMEADADLDHLTFDQKHGQYYQQPVKAMSDLREALQHYYPQSAQPDTSGSLALAISLYYSELQRRYQRLDIDTLTPQQRMEHIEVLLSSIYVEQRVRDDPPPIELPKELLEKLENDIEWEKGQFPDDIALEDVRRVSDVYYKKPSRLILDVLSDPHYSNVVILGDPGSGKSTLTRYVVLSMIGPTADSIRLNQALGDALPLLVELKSYDALLKRSNGHKDFLDYFDHLNKTEGCYFEKPLLEKYLANGGKAVMIFDGLDEVFDPEQRDHVCRYIHRFKEIYPATRIIITSRIIGFRPRILQENRYRVFTLQDLDNSQVREFIVKWYAIAFSSKPDQAEVRVNLIMQAIKESASIRELAGNPLLLTIMALLARVQELPRERWKLYDHAATVLIEIWDVSRYLKNENLLEDYIDEEDKREMLQRIAFRMQLGENGTAGNYIAGRQLQAEFETYMVDRYRLSPGVAKQAAAKMIQQLHERNFILLLYGAKLYGFVHRAFLEYFCARAIVRQFESTQTISLDQLKQDIFRNFSEDQSWHEVLRLAAGMIQPRFTGEIIQSLCEDYRNFAGVSSTFTLSGGSRGFVGFMPHKLSLAIKCLAEIKKFNLLAQPAKDLLAAICSIFFIDASHRPQLFTYFRRNILPAARSIGASWPERVQLAAILKEKTDLYPYSYIYDDVLGSFIGHIGNDLDEVYEVIRQWLGSENATLRVLCPFALATGWHDRQDTYEKLCTLAAKDPDKTVCYSAIYALSEHYRDHPGTFPLVFELATQSPYDFGRVAAISGLAGNYSKMPGVLDLLMRIAKEEEEKFPRTVAVKSLGRYFYSEPATRDLLFYKAVHDTSPQPDDMQYSDCYYVREAALDSIAEHWPDEPDTVSLLIDRLKKDPTRWLREKCQKWLLYIPPELTQNNPYS
ncbi:MAG TPA: hypothetical protein VFE32_04715 [Puia sp.]|jgi:hypothetical protein|nr:hypothetical protein [Puia sp.]